jgi:uncharacterized membrane protein YidH (DUF202 family)
MKPLVIVGIILVVVGVIALAYGSFSFTTTEKVAEVGPLKLEKEKKQRLSIPPIIGGAVVVVGVVLIVAGARSR